ncbi:MAG: hypothetical protein WCN98_06595 [Verrucomicrobiaceae bacterium]
MNLIKIAPSLGCLLAVGLLTSCGPIKTGDPTLVDGSGRYLYVQGMAEKENKKKKKMLETEGKKKVELVATDDKLSSSLAALKGEKNKQTVIRDSSTSTEREKQRARARIEELNREIERQNRLKDFQLISS